MLETKRMPQQRDKKIKYTEVHKEILVASTADPLFIKGILAQGHGS